LSHGVGQVTVHAQLGTGHVEQSIRNGFENMGWVTSKPCNGKTVSHTKTSAERAHR